MKADLFKPLDQFVSRHLSPTDSNVERMLEELNVTSLDALIDETIPQAIRLPGQLNLPEACSESEVLTELRELANRNHRFRSLIGMGYASCLTPGVIQRNVLENPGWYTQYTPYQAEIAQGRLEALLNFQTMVTDLTGMEIANASMLDEATAAAEAMTLCLAARKRGSQANVFFVDHRCHPQTIEVVQTRAQPLGIEFIIDDYAQYQFDPDSASSGSGSSADEATFGVLLQYPTSEGDLFDYEEFCTKAHEAGALVIVACDLLALTFLRPPGEFGADVAVGNSQRFGVPLGYGGPHAAFFATRDQYKRLMPGRLVGVSRDSMGDPALRLALQTREQHIRRDRATSNICTAQVLLAVMASMYAVYHGPVGLTRIAQRIRLLTSALAAGLSKLGYMVNQAPIFDTLKINDGPLRQEEIVQAALDQQVNLRIYDDGALGISLDELTDVSEIEQLLEIFGADSDQFNVKELASNVEIDETTNLKRQSDFLTHPVFNRHHSETEMLRYITRLQGRDLSLAHAMIPLGSCTMKLNATTEMIPVTWPEFSQIHPFTPTTQTAGYQELFRRLEMWLAEITGFAATSLQPNAGSQGEYAGLLAIRGYHQSRNEDQRTVCLIPSSAHGTNPASAVMAGMKVVVVQCDADGNVDVADLRAKATTYSDALAALMITYPSTHGVFEEEIIEICQIVHEHGGQVYMDGANMNAQVGLCRPGDFGVDVCHLNLHKTFCIPHGGGGPGVGPICVAEHLVPFLPKQTVIGSDQSGTGSVSAAPWGSASILPISYAYIRMMGTEGLTRATQIAILSANYIAERLGRHYPVLYTGATGRVAHECIIDLSHLKNIVSVDDVAKRLIDYGFHAPTMHFPVMNTLMIEPTESESLEELDRFCEAMIAIREEIRQIEQGQANNEQNVLTSAPHTAEMITSDSWDQPYSQKQAAYPLPWVKERKFWPYVGRIDNVYGDRNLFCVCVPVEEYSAE